MFSKGNHNNSDNGYILIRCVGGFVWDATVLLVAIVGVIDVILTGLRKSNAVGGTPNWVRVYPN